MEVPDPDPDVEWNDFDYDLFESLVAGLQKLNGVDRVEKQYQTPLNHGSSKEMDVVVWTKVSFHNIQILIECKHWNYRVDQGVVAEMISNVANSTADKGVIISKEGFQKGAIEQARGKGIELYVIKELEDGDAEGYIQKVHGKVNIQQPLWEITRVSIVSDDESKEEGEYTMRGNPSEWIILDRNLSPTGETIGDRLSSVANENKPGEYTERFSDSIVKIDGEIYELESVSYVVNESDVTSVQEFEIDLFEKYNLVMIDVLADNDDDRMFFSSKEALQAFIDVPSQE